MMIQSLAATGFRNLADIDLSPGPGVNVFYGANGAGKSNLLEAIFLLCLGRSQRGATDTSLIRENADLFRVSGDIDDGRSVSAVAVAYQRNNRKKITIEQLPVRAAELYERFCVVSLGPEDTEILSGAPARRRAFLDMHLSLFSSRYLQHLIDYHKALQQKNASLRTDQETAPFDALMISHGVELHLARREFIQSLAAAAGECYTRLAASQLELAYQSSIPLPENTPERAAVADAMRQAMDKQRERELRLQMAVVGPHRDEIVVTIDGRTARTYGSQGEWRTAAIAIKLAVYDLLRNKRGTAPILLLDEVFAELDQRRATALMESFGNLGQLFVTSATTPPGQLLETGKSFLVEAGSVREVA